MTRRIAVIGAGIAGIAAAWSAKREGAEVVLIDGGIGASSLMSGAVDDTPWDVLAHAANTLGLADARPSLLSEDVIAFVESLGVWDLPIETRSLLATGAGRVRGARGRDLGLLDLAPLVGETIALPRVDRAGWDADALAETLTDDPRARGVALDFIAIDAEVLRYGDEHLFGDLDLAERHDDPTRLAWLGERLRAALDRVDAAAVLLGPWLGIASARATDLSRLVGAPVGEILVGNGSPSGLRFERARKALVVRDGIEIIRGQVKGIARDDEGLKIDVAKRAEALEANAVVLAIGGLLGGGVIYEPPEHDGDGDFPSRGGRAFRLSLDAPDGVRIAGNKPIEIASSMHGPELDATAWPRGDKAGALETVGVMADGERVDRSIYAAGDAIAHRPRTVLEAVASGLRAGAEAARAG